MLMSPMVAVELGESWTESLGAEAMHRVVIVEAMYTDKDKVEAMDQVEAMDKVEDAIAGLTEMELSIQIEVL